MAFLKCLFALRTILLLSIFLLKRQNFKCGKIASATNSTDVSHVREIKRAFLKMLVDQLLA
jgi:hypothetical protein